MIDKYNRRIDYLRFSITDKCNHRCFYCMPADVKFLPSDGLLTIDEIGILAEIFSNLGIKQIRITGGEALLREDVVDVTKKLSKYFQLSLTTNGSKLKELAGPLRESGLLSVNVSLNSLNEDRFYEITRGSLKPVLEGIESAIDCKLFVKINTVVSQMNLDELGDLVDFSAKRGIPIRFIEMMPIGKANRGVVFEEEILKRLSAFELKPSNVKLGAGPGRYFVTKDGNYVGIISAMSRSFCTSCNKLRLSCGGKLYPEAARIVFRSGVPIVMAPLDLTHQVVATEREAEKLRSLGHRFQIMADLLMFFKSTYKRVFNIDGAILHDPCTVMYLIRPDIFESQDYFVDVEVKGELTYGQTVVDVWKTTGNRPNAKVLLKVDRERFFSIFFEKFQSLEGGR